MFTHLSLSDIVLREEHATKTCKFSLDLKEKRRGREEIKHYALIILPGQHSVDFYSSDSFSHSEEDALTHFMP